MPVERRYVTVVKPHVSGLVLSPEPSDYTGDNTNQGPASLTNPIRPVYRETDK